MLKSRSLADRVAQAVGQGVDADSIADSTVITQLPKTDIVNVRTTSADRTLARDIADAYVTEYIALLRTQIDDARAPDSERVRAELDALRAQLTLIDQDIAAAVAPFLDESRLAPGEVLPAVPAIELLSPELASQKQILLDEYAQVVATQSELEVDGRLRVSSAAIQAATLPTQPVPGNSAGPLLVVGLIGGMLLGATIVVAQTRLSGRVVNARQAEAILGVELVGSCPHEPAVNDRERLVSVVPERFGRFVDALCVRAETNARVGQTLHVVVVGSRRGAGTTTLAMAMANRYAAGGLRVALVDADGREPEITTLFGADVPGIPGLLAAASSRAATPAQPASMETERAFANPGVDRLVVLGAGSHNEVLRRDDVPDLIEALSGHADVVVFDGGPLMDAASSVQLAQFADAVVLAVPLGRERTDNLAIIGRQLSSRADVVLGVATPASRRQFPRASRAGGPAGEHAGSWTDPRTEATIVRESSRAKES